MGQFPNFVGPAYQSQSTLADGEQCINLFTEVMETAGAKSRTVLYPAPGVTSYCTEAVYFSGSPSGTFPIEAPIRGMLGFTSPGIQGNQAYAVGGSNLYLLPSSATDILASLNPVAGAAVVCNNTGSMLVDGHPSTLTWSGDGGEQLLITSGGLAYLWSTGGLAWFGAVGPSGITDISHGGFLDTFFLVLSRSSTLYISEIYDGLTWDPTQLVQRSQAADPWVSMLVVHRQIWLFGTFTTDVWWNAGTSPFPFAPVDGAQLQVGILAPYSAAEVDNAPMWLGRTSNGPGIVYHAQGYQATRVSNHALEYAISQMTDATDAIGWAYQQDGHEFYVLEFQSAGQTWVYDASVGAALGSGAAWHQRGYWEAAVGSGAFAAYRPRFHTYTYGSHLVGDRQAGTIYSLSTTVSTDVNGQGIRRVRRTPHLSNEQERLFFKSLQIDLEVGLGLTSGQGSDPQLMLRWSNDGGKTWSNEHWVTAGALGVYKTRAIWERLGSGRDRVFEVSISDPTPWRFVQAFLDVSKGLS